MRVATIGKEYIYKGIKIVYSGDKLWKYDGGASEGKTLQHCKNQIDARTEPNKEVSEVDKIAQ